jgi:predicted nucleic acid-binding protein
VIVVDTNLLVYLYVEGQRTREAEAVLSRDPTWSAPLLWRSEFRNTLAQLVRRRSLALDDALQIAHEAERTMTGREYSVVSADVLQLSARSGCSAYDCEFVALARDLALPLVTADGGLLRAFPDIAIAPTAFATK